MITGRQVCTTVSGCLRFLLLAPMVAAFPVSARSADTAGDTNSLPDMAAVDVMSGAAFEKLACRLLQAQGYQVSNMRAANDYGVDIIASKDTGTDLKQRVAIQCKRSKNKITRSAVSDAVAGMKYYQCDKAMVVTNSEFTEDAREFARGTDCILVDRAVLQQWLSPGSEPPPPQQNVAPPASP